MQTREREVDQGARNGAVDLPRLVLGADHALVVGEDVKDDLGTVEYEHSSIA